MEGCTLTKQEMFDTVLNGLRAQGHPSSERTSKGNKVCLYRGPNGDRCAAGWLIPDELYSKTMEGTRVSADSTLMEYFGTENLTLVQDLQRLHDEWAAYGYSMHTWEDAMTGLARHYGLSYTSPQAKVAQPTSRPAQELCLRPRLQPSWAQHVQVWKDEMAFIPVPVGLTEKDFAHHEISYF